MVTDVQLTVCKLPGRHAVFITAFLSKIVFAATFLTCSNAPSFTSLCFVIPLPVYSLSHFFAMCVLPQLSFFHFENSYTNKFNLGEGGELMRRSSFRTSSCGKLLQVLWKIVFAPLEMSTRALHTNLELQNVDQQTGREMSLHDVWIQCDSALSPRMLWSEWTLYNYPRDLLIRDAIDRLSK